LEAIVEGRIIQLLGDAMAIDSIVSPRARDVEERRHFVDCASELAANWHSLRSAEKMAILQQRLVRAIVVTATTVEISLRAEAIVTIARQPIGRIAANDGMTYRMNNEDDGEIITLTVTATLKRVGMEMRHLVEASAAHPQREPDRSLLRILARAHRFRDQILRGEQKTLADLAAENNISTAYFSRIVHLGFLAPDITAAVLEGRQPITLSAKKLAETPHLSPAWTEQPRELGSR
jgi:hypothetical protein